jgi:cytochrome b561
LPLPDFVPVNRDLSELLKDAHGALAMALAAVVVVHVAGAVKHQWIDRDRLLHRMLPARRAT